MWLMESYSLRTSTIRGTGERKFLSNSAIRLLRSAASQYQAWDLMVSKPKSAYFEKQKRLICQPVRSADGLGCSLFAAGIGACIGENANPFIALLDQHVRCLMADLEESYLSAHMPQRWLALLLFYYGSDGCAPLKPLSYDGMISM